MSRCLLKIVFVIGFVYINLFFIQSHAARENDLLRFISISDIHFDPFITCYREKTGKPCPLIGKLQRAPIEEWAELFMQYDTDPPYYKLNTNYPLLNFALTVAKNIAKQNDAQFILVLGDFIGHDYQKYYEKYSMDYSESGYQLFFKKTLEYLTHELTKAFPNIDVFPVIGNNDSYYGDYIFHRNGEFYNVLQSIWISLIKDKTNRTLMKTSFLEGGYYVAEIPHHPDLRLIVLNTVLFSNRAIGRGINQAAWEELNWLHKQLELAHSKHQHVMIAMHIPPGVDIYASLEFRLFRLLDLWKLEYTKRFESELREFASDILIIFAGHLHTDWFQVLTLNNIHRIPITGTPSVSPIYGNNPGFKLYTYSAKSQRIVNFETYSYSIHTNHLWQRESYRNRYNHNKFSEV